MLNISMNMQWKRIHNNLYSFTRWFHFFLPESSKEYLARRLVGFSADQMYTVVADIKNYRKFVPFCNQSTIISENPGEVEANLVVGFPPLSENYTSKVTLVKPSLVQAVCHDGKLFKYLETTWKFSPGLKSNEKSCVIEFYINFEFKSPLHSRLATLFFDSMVKQMEHAFITEARRRYGTESIPLHTLTVYRR